MTDAPRRAYSVMLSEVREMRRLRAQGLSCAAIGTRLGLTATTVWRHLGKPKRLRMSADLSGRKRSACRQQAFIDRCNAAIGLSSSANFTAAPLNPYP